MADESKQHWLDRNRPPRVQITYDVETGGASEKKEIPFVVGVLSDLSGATPKTGLNEKLKDRKFVEIDRDNFNSVLASVKPSVQLKEVPNMMTDELDSDGKRKQLAPIDLSFSHINDFKPERIVEMYEPLRKLLEARTKLNDLLGKLEGNDGLSDDLRAILNSQAQLDALKTHLVK